MAELKASPRNATLGGLSDILRSIRDTGDRVEIPVLGGLGSMFLGQSPEEINEWAYGNFPMQMTPQGVRLPQMKRGRGAQVADTVFAAADLPALRTITAAAGRPLARAMERSIENVAPLRALRELHESRSMIPMSNVIKQKGGNWLSGSVEGALGGLKRDVPFEGYRSEYVPTNYTDPGSSRFKWKNSRTGQILTDDEYARLQDSPPINTWIDKQLTRYVKNEMATPEDPVRALAERGVLHFPARERNPGPVVTRDRLAAGFPEEGVAQSQLAKNWEDTSDKAIWSDKVGNIPYTDQLPDWIKKLKVEKPSAIHHTMNRGIANDDLGFDHLIDELSNAINPDSGLPRHLQFPADRLDRVSVPQAVERVAEINAWRAAQKAEVDAMRANNAATVLHKEYPDKGMKWVELKAGESISPTVRENDRGSWDLLDRTGHIVSSFKSREGAERALSQFSKSDPRFITGVSDASKQALADALKYEGDTMGHCVGGYCDDVASGRSRIYSLRDAKGQPHVTIEVQPPAHEYPVSGEEFAMLPQETKDRYRAITAEWRKSNPDDPEVWKALAEAGVEPTPPRIVQIKGRQNRAPNPEYLPFVQDFVKSGKWSDVGDLQNTGLTKHHTGKYISDDEAAALAKRHFGDVKMGNRPDDVENPWQYANRIRRYDLDMLSETDKAFLADWDAGNFASGGPVINKLSPNLYDGIIAALNRT